MPEPDRAGPSPDGLDTSYAGAAHSPGLLLWQVTNRWQAAMRATLVPFDLTHVQFVLLAALTYRGAGSPISQRQLAQDAATDPMMTSQVLRALERRDLVHRDTDPGDARARAVSVTPAGRALVNRAVVAVEDCDERFFAPLGPGAPGLAAALRALSG